MDKKSELPTGSGPTMEHGFYCPTRCVEGTFSAAFPALEICPACQNVIGIGPGKCRCHVFPGSIYSIRTGTGAKVKPAAPRTFTNDFNIGDLTKVVGTVAEIPG